MNPKIHHLVVYHNDQTTRPPKSLGGGGVNTRASNTEVAEEQLREQQTAKQTTESASVRERKETLIKEVSPIELSIITYWEQKVLVHKAGHIKLFYNQWCSLTSNKEVLETVSGIPIDIVGYLRNYQSMLSISLWEGRA